MIRMGVAGQVAYRNIPVYGPLNAAGTEDAVGVAVDQQRQSRRCGMGRILFIATAIVVDGEG